MQLNKSCSASTDDHVQAPQFFLPQSTKTKTKFLQWFYAHLTQSQEMAPTLIKI
jgi:hypothetical protein